MTINVRKVSSPWLALGLAVHYLARRAPFSGFKASDLVKTLDQQIRRGHYLFALEKAEEEARVVGFIGWALYGQDDAERFARTGIPPSEDLPDGGDVVWILTVGSDDRRAFFALLKAGRALYPDHRAMAIRHRSGGRRVMFDRPRPRRSAARPAREGGF